MDLPERAKAMYKTWWNFVSFAASKLDNLGAFKYTLTDATAAAAEIARTVGGVFAKWDPIGLSQLFSAARRLAGIGQTLDAAPDETVTTTLDIPEAPWSRPVEDQVAAPKWLSKVQATYVNEIGQQVTEYFTVINETALPGTVGDLKTQIATSIDQMLTGQAENGTPRRGQLMQVESFNLMVI